MKKILGVIFLSLFLSGCATAPSSVVQDTLIKEGNIKIGMKYTNLLQALGGEGAVFPIYPMGYEKNFRDHSSGLAVEWVCNCTLI